MRYSKQHKIETHGRIVARAAARLREKGVHGIGVADLMKDAGLTHGGFYAHFSSREALVIEAFSQAMDASVRNWREAALDTPADARLEKLVGDYLTVRHRDTPARGCTLPTLGADIVRESPKTRRAFAGKVEEMIAEIAALLPAASEADAKRQAIAALSTMIGSLLLARVAGTGELSDTVLKTGREMVGIKPSRATGATWPKKASPGRRAARGAASAENS